jgi:UDP-glucose 4-epimerase
MKKILVTGGLGFIGHHLVNLLLEYHSGCSITIVDNLSSTIIDYSHLKNKAVVHILDLRNFALNPRVDFEHIYHLASPVGSLGILKKNGYIAKDILELTYKIIEITKATRARLLYVSSSEVYGHTGNHDESARKYIPTNIGTRTEYLLGKLTSEIILHNISQTDNFTYNICRPFNIIGEHQDSSIGFVVPTFFENAIKGQDLPVFYDGLQKRSFCHVQDLVRALVQIQESNKDHDVFNVGNDSNITTIKNLAHQIINLTSSNSSVVHIDPTALYGKLYVEAFDKIPNVQKISSMIGWKPQIALDNALERVWKYYKGRKMVSAS